MKKIFLMLLLLIGTVNFAQTSVNNYKYIVVPSRYHFQTDKDQFRLNTLTKLLLAKYGFTVYLESDDMPDDVANYNCNKLYADVESAGNFIRTKLIVVLKDCRGNVVYSSAEGKSKEKDFGKAYNEALRDAFRSFETLHYKYIPQINPNTVLQKTEPAEPISEAPITIGEPLAAQPITNGYHLVNGAGKVLIKIFRTSKKDVYLAIKGDIQGVLVSDNGQWLFEYYKDDQLVSERISVKF